MKKYAYNENINYLEIDPQYLSDGLHFAEEANHTSIRIRALNLNAGSRYDLDLSPFTHKIFVERLIINDDFNILPKNTIEPIYSLANLKHLQFTHSFTVDFSKLPQLTSLYFTYNKKVQNLDALQNLIDLLVTSYTGDDCNFFSKLENLKMLRLTLGTISSLNGLQMLKQLSSLNLVSCNNLQFAEAIAATNIEKLHVEKCKLLTNYAFLEKNKTIRDLFISELDTLSFVESMSKLEKINFWNCKDGKLSPLLANKSLKIIWFTPDRKHYSHKKKEIDAKLK